MIHTITGDDDTGFFTYSIDGRNIGTWIVEEQINSDMALKLIDNIIYLRLSDNNYNIGVIRSGDTIMINEEEATGTMVEKFYTIRDTIFE